MSKISKLWKGSSSSSSGANPQEAIQRLRETEEMLAKKQDYLEKKIEEELMVAKKNGMKNKQAALKALKRKKRFEQQLTQIDGTLNTIEFQREALENASTHTEVLKNMSFAAKALKEVQQNMDTEKIYSIKDDIAEQQELAQEIARAISEPPGETFDEDELLAELEELEQEEFEESMMNSSRLPSAHSSQLPTARPSQHASSKKKVVEDDDELQMLAAWAP